jgi:hypothetical protein
MELRATPRSFANGPKKRLRDEEGTGDRCYTSPPPLPHSSSHWAYRYIFSLLEADGTDPSRGVVFPPPRVFGLPRELLDQTISIGDVGDLQRGVVVLQLLVAIPGLEDTEVSLPSHHLRCIWMKVCPMHVYIRQYQSFGVPDGAGG